MKGNILRIGDKMRQVIKLLMMMTIITVLIPEFESFAMQNGITMEEGNQPTSSTDSTNDLADERLEGFISDLTDLWELEHFEIEMNWTNLDTEKELGKVTVLGDSQSGDLAGELNFYFPEYYPQEAKFNFLTYQRYDMAYVQQFKLLDSLAFFKQPFFNYKFDQDLAWLQDYYVQIQPSDIQTVGLNHNPLEALLLLPDDAKLSSIDPDALEEDDRSYHLTLERLEIPMQFFGSENFFNISYNYAYALQASTTSKRGFTPLDNQTSHTFNFNEEEAFFNFSVDITADITDSLLAPYPELNVRAVAPSFDKEMGLSSVGLMEKLTKVEITYDPELTQYVIVLEGMVENVDFNLFSDGSAGLSTNHMRIEYKIFPTDQRVPQLSDIEKMSSSEADYYLEQLLDQDN